MTKENVDKMIRRRELLIEDPDGNEEEADAILEEVLQSGGLTAEEIDVVSVSSIPAGKAKETTPLEVANRENVREQVIRAKEALAERDFSTYWNTVYGIVALIGGSDDGDEKEDDYIDMVNRKLGGPGT
jgi:hypothetical protein